MKMILQSLFLFALILLGGCAGGQKLVATEDSPDCSATVEGFFQSKVLWTKGAPALVIKDGWQPTIIYGELLEAKDDGVVFDARREGFYDAPAKLYPSKDVICAVDKDGQPVYGKIPKDYSTGLWNLDLYLVPSDQPEAKPYILSMKTNERFSYCLRPGAYVIKKIIFSSSRNYVDETVNLPRTVLQVTDGCVNYLGDLFLDYEATGNPNVHSLPFKVRNRPEAIAASQFGLVGALLYAAANKNKPGVHTLLVKINDEYSPESELPLKNSPLQFSD